MEVGNNRRSIADCISGCSKAKNMGQELLLHELLSALNISIQHPLLHLKFVILGLSEPGACSGSLHPIIHNIKLSSDITLKVLKAFSILVFSLTSDVMAVNFCEYLWLQASYNTRLIVAKVSPFKKISLGYIKLVGGIIAS